MGELLRLHVPASTLPTPISNGAEMLDTPTQAVPRAVSHTGESRHQGGAEGEL